MTHEDKSGDFEWTATVVNLNHPELDKNLFACKALADYTLFVKKVQAYKQESALEAAINRAVEECIQENVLKDVLLSHKAEVVELILTEFDKEKYEQDLREDAREEGLAEGRAVGLAEGRAEGLTEGLVSSVKTAAIFTLNIQQIHAAVIQNPVYQDVTLKQVEDILNEK